MQTREVSEFIFSNAEYHLKDSIGNSYTLRIDYKENKYHILTDSKVLSTKKEISEIAQELLDRKHNKNFAQRR